VTVATFSEPGDTPQEVMDALFHAANAGYSDESIKDFRNLDRRFFASNASRIKASTFVHEESHFYQLIGSPFGRLLSDLDHVFAIHVRAAIQSSKGSIQAPYYLALRDAGVQRFSANVNDLLPLKDASNSLLQLAMAFGVYNLKAAFYGQALNYDRSFLGIPTIGMALSLWDWFINQVDWLENSESTDDLVVEQIHYPLRLSSDLSLDEPSTPIIDGSPIGPREILEGAALELQLTWLRDVMRTEPTELPYIMRLVNPGRSNPEYLACRRLISRLFPSRSYEQRRSLLLILSDIALNGPISTRTLSVPREAQWEDLSPGYRFLRAALLTAQEQSTARSMTGRVVEDYDAVTQFVCNTFGWPTPSSIAAMLVDETQPESSYRDLLLPWRKRAARARLEEPALFAEPGPSTNELSLHDKYALIIPFMVDDGRVRGDLNEEKGKLLIDTAFLTSAIECFFEANITPLFNEPPELLELVYSRVAEMLSATVRQRGRHESKSKYAPLAKMDAILSPIVENLRSNKLGGIASFVKIACASGDPSVVAWYQQQPAAALALLSGRRFDSDGSFTMTNQDVYSTLRSFPEALDGNMEELLEDIGQAAMVSQIRFVKSAGFTQQSSDST